MEKTDIKTKRGRGDRARHGALVADVSEIVNDIAKKSYHVITK